MRASTARRVRGPSGEGRAARALHFRRCRQVFLGHLRSVNVMNATEVKTPRPVMGVYDKPMWESIRAGAMPEDGCIGRAMRLIYVTMPDGVMLPRWRYEG